MKIAIMQPYLFPYIGYFQLINAVDKFVIYDNVNYIKGGWINRNRILINNKPYLLTLKLQKPSVNKLILNTFIDKNLKNKLRILKSIKISYRKAPFYNDAIPVLERIILNSEMNLSKYITNSIILILEYLGVKKEILLASQINIDKSHKGEKKILDIVKRLDGDIYVNLPGGVSLYNPLNFKNNNIKLLFISPGITKYRQFNDLFISNLSIVDVLMFNSATEIRKMLKNYTLF